jgi:DUF1365 family protein
LNSCIYRGKVFHKRFMPVMHSFIYTLDYIYLNLDEIESTFATSVFWSANKTNWVSFKRQDYLPSTRELKKEVCYKIQEISGENFTGEVYMLATLRSLGYCMNPITLFYCFDKETNLRHVLVEVHNTPWNQRHTYLLSGPNFNDETHKKFHVSPFMPMDTTYKWGIGDPEESLNVSIQVSQKDQQLFNANLALERIEITKANQLIFIHVRQAFRMIVGIYFHALKLWIKKVPFYGHPDKNVKIINNENI